MTTQSDKQFHVTRAYAWLIGLALGACTAGPHPLPPGELGPHSTAADGGIPVSASAGISGSGLAAAGTGSFGNGEPSLPPAPSGSGVAGSGAAGSGATRSADAGTMNSGIAGSAADAGETPGAPGSLTLGDDAHYDPVNTSVLLMFDRSSSTWQPWQSGSRWQDASQAVIDAFTSEAARLTLGAVLYPSPSTTVATVATVATQSAATTQSVTASSQSAADGCQVAALNTLDQLPFTPASFALPAFTATLARSQALAPGQRALGEAIARADEALSQLPASVYPQVVILADGAAACTFDEGNAQATLAAWLQSRDIPSYVIALPGADAASCMTLSALAAAGGTGSAKIVADPGALQAALSAIASDARALRSCELHLSPAAPVADKLGLVVEKHGLRVRVPPVFESGEAAWSLSADGSTVSLLGAFCNAAQRGAYHSLTFMYTSAQLPTATQP